MDHKLRVIDRLNVAPASAVIAVSGCVTVANATALLPIIRRFGELIGSPGLMVDIAAARHVDQRALDYLQFPGTGVGSEPFDAIAPAVLYSCPDLAKLLRYDTAA